MNRIKATAAQLTHLAEYMTNHPDVAAGYAGNSLQGRVDLETKWKNLAVVLNSMDGAIKTPSKWRQTWRDLRNNLKKKTSLGTSELEMKVMSVMTPVTVLGMDDIPIAEPIKIQAPTPSPASSPLHYESPPEPQTNFKSQPRKRSRMIYKQDSFYTQLLRIERDKINIERIKLKLEKEKINVKKERNQIEESRNSTLNRISGMLENIHSILQNND